MSFPEHTLHFNIHPCMPLSNRLEKCWASAHFSSQCDALRADLVECFRLDKSHHYNNVISLHSSASDVRVPVFDIVADRFEGMAADQTLRANPSAPSQTQV